MFSRRPSPLTSPSTTHPRQFVPSATTTATATTSPSASPSLSNHWWERPASPASSSEEEEEEDGRSRLQSGGPESGESDKQRKRQHNSKQHKSDGASRRSHRPKSTSKFRRWPSPSALLPSSTSKMPMPLPRVLRREALALVAEFCGTFSYLLLGLCATQLVLGNERAAEDGRLGTTWLGGGVVMVISLAWGAAAVLSLWLFNPMSGGMFNPAITVGLAATGSIPPLRAILLLIPAQLGAGIAAAAATSKLTPGPFRVATNISGFLDFTQAWFVEMLLTSQLVFAAFLLLGAGRAKAQAAVASPSVPLGIGLAVFVAHIAGTNFTGAAVNPARSLGTDLVAGFKFGFWIYYGGPMTGAAIAFAVYVALGWVEGYFERRRSVEDVERGWAE